MSFIIKALKKLEEENATRKGTPAAINSAILAPDRGSSVQPRRWARWLAIPAVFVAGAVLSWLAMHRTTPPVPEKEARQVIATPAAPPAPGGVSGAVPAPGTVSAAPPLPSPPAVVSPPPALTPPAVQTASPPPPLRTDRVARLAREGNPSVAPSPSTVPSPQASADAAPSSQLVVNGIAYQDDPAASSAVVNGQFVKQGMSVGGARVERIFPNKVRFSGSGGTFEVTFSR